MSVDWWNVLLVDDLPTGGAGLLAYDPAGNRLTQTDPVTGEITTFAYDNGNRLILAVDVSGTTTRTYDANGNQLTIEEPSGDITTNTRDGENRLSQVEHPFGDIMTYAYNGDGLLVLQDDGVDEVRYVHDGNNLILETDGVGTVEAEFTYIPQAYAEVISQHRDLESSFYQFDGTSNVRQLTDDTQVVTDDYSFDAWGDLTSSTGSTANSQLWKGQYLAYRKDPNAGPEVQYAMHHRNYDPKTGVFTSTDPAKEDRNLYRYSNNNPVNRADPSGLEDEGNVPHEQRIPAAEGSIEDAMIAFLGWKIGLGFLRHQGTAAANRLVDIWIWGWRVKVGGYDPLRIDRTGEPRVIHVPIGVADYPLGDNGTIEYVNHSKSTLFENIKKAIYSHKVTQLNRDSGPESPFAAGAASFAAHPNVRIVTGAIEVAGSILLVIETGGLALPAVIATYGVVRGGENIGNAIYESATGEKTRLPSHQLLDQATGNEETTDRIIFWTDIGVAVVDTAQGARHFYKTSKAAKTTAAEASKLAETTASGAVDAGKLTGAAPSSLDNIASETADALKHADAPATPPSGSATTPPKSATTISSTTDTATDTLVASSAVVPAESIVDSVIGVGHHAGGIVSDATITQLSERLLRNGVTIDRTEAAVSILDNRKAYAGFSPSNDKKTAKLLLRPDATRYDIAHELKHYEEWLADKSAFVERGSVLKGMGNVNDPAEMFARAKAKFEAEKYVFDSLNETHSNRLTVAEKKTRKTVYDRNDQ